MKSGNKREKKEYGIKNNINFCSSHLRIDRSTEEH